MKSYCVNSLECDGYRLWHQLTLRLIDFFDHPLSRPYRVDVFAKFVRDFETKLNQLRLVDMGVKVAKEIDSMFSPLHLPGYFLKHIPNYRSLRNLMVAFDIADPSTEVTFFNELLSRIPTSKAPDAHVLLLATIAGSKLMYGDNEGAKVDMDEAWKVLDNLSDVESRVRAAYYHVAADYYKVKSPPCMSYGF